MEQHITTIDLDNLTETSAAELVAGLSEYGLAYIRGHGIDPELLEAFYREFIAFTELPDAEKRALGGDAIWHQRGWKHEGNRSRHSCAGHHGV